MARVGCAGRAAAKRLQRDAIASVGGAPPAFQEPLLSGVNDVVAQVTACARNGPSITVTRAPNGVQPVPHESGAAAQARALAAWLRRYSG